MLAIPVFTTYKEFYIMLENITLDTLINHLGTPRKIGGEYVWQCPYCMDSHKDNLKYNEQKGLLKCFANDTHAGAVLSDINKREGIDTSKTNSKPINRIVEVPKLTLEQLEENTLYMLSCNEELLSNHKALNHLMIKRGITKQTAELCGIGIDKELHKWVFPIISYPDNDVIGFEYRPALLPNAIKAKRTEAENQSKKGISRKKGSLSGMAMINTKTNQTEALAIVEGYLDGYALFQYLQEQGQADYYHVVTPSNGISSLLKQIEYIRFSDYKQIYLYVDSDDKSKPILEQIIKKYPFIKPVQLECCKDFNEHYMKCIGVNKASRRNGDITPPKEQKGVTNAA